MNLDVFQFKGNDVLLRLAGDGDLLANLRRGVGVPGKRQDEAVAGSYSSHELTGPRANFDIAGRNEAPDADGFQVCDNGLRHL